MTAARPTAPEPSPRGRFAPVTDMLDGGPFGLQPADHWLERLAPARDMGRLATRRDDTRAAPAG